jgi:type VI secretion system protein ImpK
VQPNSPESPFHDLKQDAEHPASGENLALLYQGLLTGIVRLKAQRQQIPDSETFRKRTKATLQEVERVAVATGYGVSDVRDTHFAVVAFLDSVILHSKDPIGAEWKRKTLQEELFGQTDAGVVFFEKLEQFRSRRDSPQLADILEVYLLCLLLGFEGRYSGGQRGELEGIIQSLRMRIEYIRGREDQISPAGSLPPALAPQATPPGNRKDRLRLVTLGLVIFTLVCFWILRLNLISLSEELRDRLF